MFDDGLLVEKPTKGVVVLRLDRPARRNALTGRLIQALRQTCERLAASTDVWCVVITGTEGAFCSGLDLDELGDAGTNLDASFIDAIRALPQPTIAAIDGPAVTAGLEMALACDVRLGSGRARFADTHVRVGVLPGGGASVLLARLIGPGRAKEMSLSGRYIDAEEAERWGLLNRLVHEGNVVEAAIDLGRDIIANDPRLVQRIKLLIDESQDRGVREALAWERERFDEFSLAFESRGVAERRDQVIRRGRGESERRGSGGATERT